jgi:hypothetical protein
MGKQLDAERGARWPYRHQRSFREQGAPITLSAAQGRAKGRALEEAESGDHLRTASRR